MRILRHFPSKHYLLLILAVLLFGTVTVGYYRYSQPIDAPTVQSLLQAESSSTPFNDIAWPTTAAASFGTVEDGILISLPDQKPLPTASTAKLITVLTVLKNKPLSLGEQGPLLTIDQEDIALYNAYYAAGGSLVDIELGEKLSQYQMLQGILIRSGNNLADSLAIWAFGSLEEYRIAAQAFVEELGMKNTTIGIDASGLSPTTTSTADDLTLLGIAAMKNDVVREIVRQTTSSLPVDGTKPSTNWLLGENGVVGIKTGNIPEIGGVFIIASEYAVEGEKPITIVGTVQGEGSTYDAISLANKLAETIKPFFIKRTIVKKGDVVATVTTAWGEHSNVIAEHDVTVFGWKYAAITPEVTLRSDTSFQKDTVLGTVSAGGQTSNLIAANAINAPSWQWRIMRSR